jgi:hypothetical protein
VDFRLWVCAKHQEEAARSRVGRKNSATTDNITAQPLFHSRATAENPGPPRMPAAMPPNWRKELPVIPAVWTGHRHAKSGRRANGKISGTNFIVETASLGIIGNAHVLSLRRGLALRLIAKSWCICIRRAVAPGHVWTVSKEMKGAGVPQVNGEDHPKFAPMLKALPAMR